MHRQVEFVFVEIWRMFGIEKDFLLLCIENKGKVMRRSDIVYRIKDALRQVAPEVKVILYGSEARGDAREDSDIDLLLVVDKDVVTLEDRMRLMEPLYEIELETGVQINPFIETLRRWGERFTPFYENVTREGVVL